MPYLEHPFRNKETFQVQNLITNNVFLVPYLEYPTWKDHAVLGIAIAIPSKKKFSP